MQRFEPDTVKFKSLIQKENFFWMNCGKRGARADNLWQTGTVGTTVQGTKGRPLHGRGRGEYIYDLAERSLR